MNKQADLVNTLIEMGPLTENMLMICAFGYNRNHRWSGSNKKYAELLRRALKSGKIKRISVNSKEVAPSRYVYYVER